MGKKKKKKKKEICHLWSLAMSWERCTCRNTGISHSTVGDIRGLEL